MVAEDDTGDENSLSSQESAIRNLHKLRSTHSRKSGGIFSNPFKTDREKMDQLTEFLNYYSANGIPEAGNRNFVDEIYELEEHWKCFVDNADELPKRLHNQQDAIWELLQTEVFYIKMLKIDNEKMFSNITVVYTANHQFWVDHLLPMLTESRVTRKPLNPILMKEGFLNFEQIFQPYIKYCLEHSNCLHYVKKKHKESELFKTYVVWCETRKDCDRLRLMDILVKPMQRLTKYSLLLKAILKKTDAEDQKEALKQMVTSFKCMSINHFFTLRFHQNQAVERFVYKVDATLRRRNEEEKLASIAKRIESYDVFDTSNDEVEKVSSFIMKIIEF
ncbi:pleckstriny domain-containing family G member 5-like protein [Dinothrombium tinctorium]|uniref:Pleckstriny domain-containing family G member 5-like protein n=1 Tax=Dinothrombium tinctorium TaxID=1965070 RepID=A0A443QUN9_9ACAR|nr:pleckstriny domain-containing family G member 5-like protein [Dinothrombium tinctorium]